MPRCLNESRPLRRLLLCPLRTVELRKEGKIFELVCPEGRFHWPSSMPGLTMQFSISMMYEPTL